MAMRITGHNGRKGKNGVYSAKHNDRNFDLNTEQAKHIDASLTEKNFKLTVQFDDGIKRTFEEAERKFYEDHFQKSLDEKNQRYINQRHPERCKTMDKYRTSEQSCPEETLRQIGNHDEHADIKTLKKVETEFVKWHCITFPQCKYLTIAGHFDEPDAAPHFHERKVWIAHDDDGNEMVGQSKALDEMGIKPPKEYTQEQARERVLKRHKDDEKKPDDERIEREIKTELHKLNHSRYNNPKMTYTDMCREKYIEICKEHRLDIEERPREASKSGQELIEYKRQQDEERAQKALESLQDIQVKKSTLETQIGVLGQNKAVLEGVVQQLTNNKAMVVQQTADARNEYNAYMTGWTDPQGRSYMGLPALRTEYQQASQGLERSKAEIGQAFRDFNAIKTNTEALQKQHDDLKPKVEVLEAKEKTAQANIDRLTEQIEARKAELDKLGESIGSAKRMADEIIRNATKNADEIITTAKAKADDIDFSMSLSSRMSSARKSSYYDSIRQDHPELFDDAGRYISNRAQQHSPVIQKQHDGRD